MGNFPFKANTHVTAYTPRDYSNDEPSPSEYDLNCSLGVNRESVPQEVFDKLGSLGPNNDTPVKAYPHDESIKDEIVAYYRKKNINNITAKNIILCDGSVGFLTHICFLFLGKDRTVYGHKPQFTAFLDSVQYSGAKFEGYEMKKENNFSFIPSEYIAGMNSSHDLFIVENAINPTGQILQLEDISTIAEQANMLNTVLIVDEAYGDYISDFSQTAINMINQPKYKNVIVSRTFSKGFGMAGIRLGYAIASEEICEQLSKIEIHFNATSISRLATSGMLASNKNMINYNEISKTKNDLLTFIEALPQKNLKVATTGATTPIITLYTTTSIPGDKSLFKLFLENRVLVVDCAVYEALDNKCVRIMFPDDPTDMNKLKAAIANISSAL